MSHKLPLVGWVGVVSLLGAAYLRLVSCGIFTIASARLLAPSSYKLLEARLQAGIQCQVNGFISAIGPTVTHRPAQKSEHPPQGDKRLEIGRAHV